MASRLTRALQKRMNRRIPKAQTGYTGVSDLDQFLGWALAGNELAADQAFGQQQLGLAGMYGYIPPQIAQAYGLSSPYGPQEPLPTLSAAQLEAELAANPRDLIKLAFFRAGQPVPSALGPYSPHSGIGAGDPADNYQFVYENGAPVLVSPKGDPAVYAKVVDKNGNVAYVHMQNPYVFESTFGKGAWKQIKQVNGKIDTLGPVIEPTTLDQNQKMLANTQNPNFQTPAGQEPYNPNNTPLPVGTKVGEIYGSGAGTPAPAPAPAPTPTAVSQRWDEKTKMEQLVARQDLDQSDAEKLAALRAAMAALQDSAGSKPLFGLKSGGRATGHVLTTVGEGGKAEVAMLAPGSVVAPLSKRQRKDADGPGLTYKDAMSAILKQLQKKRKGKVKKSQDGEDLLPEEFLELPYIKELIRQSQYAQYYPGTTSGIEGAPYNPISPYGGDVAFTLKSQAPSEAGGTSSFISSYGIPPEDFISEAAKTISLLGVAPRNARTMFAPVLS